MNTLDAELQMDLLRTYSLNFIRMGMPSKSEKQKLIKILSPLFPTKESAVSKELAQILLYLDADGIVKKLVERLEYHTEQKTVTEGVEIMKLLYVVNNMAH